MIIAWYFLLIILGINLIAGSYIFYRKKHHLLDIGIEVDKIHIIDSSAKMNITFTIYNNLDELFYLHKEASLLTNDSYRISFFITTNTSIPIILPKQSYTISVTDINIPFVLKRQFISEIAIENMDGQVYKAGIPRQFRKSYIERQVINAG